MERPRWVLLVYRIPREPSRHRVAVWRKLRDLGALYLKDGVAALPEDAVTREQLEWLQLRVRRLGERRPSGREDQGPRPRKPSWWKPSVPRGRRPIEPSSPRPSGFGARHRWAAGRYWSGSESWSASSGQRGAGTTSAPRSGARQLRRSRPPARPQWTAKRRPEPLGRGGRGLMLWATRQGCHVDRTACIWLIRCFVDPDATFSFFGDPAVAPEGAELFDVVGARLSHRGEDCSFETFLGEYALDDPVLREIAEIVHDADLMDEKYARPESEGLDAIVRGMQLSLPDDQTLSAHTDVLYEGLYAYLSREVL